MKTKSLQKIYLVVTLKINMERRNIIKEFRKCDVNGCNKDSNNNRIRLHSQSKLNLCNKHYIQMCKYGVTTNNRSLKNDLTDKKFNKLTVKYQTKFENGRGGWYCECECGGNIIVRSDWLKKGYVKSCGKCSLNTYKFYNDYVIVYGSNGLCFEIDLEDYPEVSKHTWRVIEKTKRVFATINKETIQLHQFIMNVDNAEAIDHIDGNPSNNRRYNLRDCTIQQNCCNQRLRINNTSGITGVWWSNEKFCWVAELKYKQKKVLYKYCNNFIQAVIIRVKAEVEYFKEFRSTRNDININNILMQYGYTLEEILSLGVGIHKN